MKGWILQAGKGKGGGGGVFVQKRMSVKNQEVEREGIHQPKGEKGKVFLEEKKRLNCEHKRTKKNPGLV